MALGDTLARATCLSGLAERPKNVPVRSSFFAVNIMDVQPVFRELLALLNEHKADYLIIGGCATRDRSMRRTGSTWLIGLESILVSR